MSVRAVKWQGWCDKCGEPAPEMRDTEDEARADAEECESEACLADKYTDGD